MKIDSRGRITIPKPIREQLGLHPGVEVELIPTEDGILIRKQMRGKHPVEQLRGIIKLRGAASVDE